MSAETDRVKLASVELNAARNMVLPPKQMGQSPDGTVYIVPPEYSKALVIQHKKLELANALKEARNQIKLVWSKLV